MMAAAAGSYEHADSTTESVEVAIAARHLGIWNVSSAACDLSLRIDRLLLL